MFDDFQMYQQILFDLSANYLEPLNGTYQRLAYLSGLREATSGRYVHEGLASAYSSETVDQVIAQCHEEVFERLLEMPLNAQGEELRAHVRSMPGTMEGNVMLCRKICGNWIPPHAPSYLRELYSSNLHALLELLQGDMSTARPDN